MSWFSLNSVSNFSNLSSTKLSIWVYMILSRTFDMWDKTLTGLQFSSSKSLFFSNVELTFAAFKSSGKQPFLKHKLIIFVRIEVWISSRNISNWFGFVLSNLKTYCRTLSSLTSWKEKLSDVFKTSWDFRILW